MIYQLLMIASESRETIQSIHDQTRTYAFLKATRIESVPAEIPELTFDWYGFCVLHRDGPRKDDILSRFVRECVQLENRKGVLWTSQIVRTKGELPTDDELLTKWRDWVPSSKQKEKQAAVQGSFLKKTPSCRDETIHEAQKIFKPQSYFSNSLGYMETMVREGLLRDGLPIIFWDALDRASLPQEFDQILDLLKRIVSTVSTGHEEDQKLNRLKLLAAADPALFLSFCHPKPVEQDKLAELFNSLLVAIGNRFFGRVDLVRTLTANLIRRLAGDINALTPLLYGPPGTGKSFLVTQLAAALTEAGIPSTTVFQGMTEGGNWRGDEHVLFQLTGTAAHYSNSTCGSIYRGTKSRDHRLALVLLDEAEKCGERNFLVNLLDPRLPLEDSYVKGLMGAVDMRLKTVFFLSANDTAPLRHGPDDPLWSRLQPCYLRPYTLQELEELLVYKVKDESPFSPGERKTRKVVKNILTRHSAEAGLRKLLDEVNNELFLDSLGRRDLLADAEKILAAEPAKPIGFRVAPPPSPRQRKHST